jgi:N-acetyl-1-D-myo-inositol-2-amino-2-deoxy-alpha-D-glucopyranoside deacetylase
MCEVQLPVQTLSATKPFDRLLAVFAHPDDEAFTSGGSFAALRERGGDVTLICATRGEVGEIRVPELATQETLGQVREGELRRAMAIVGVEDVQILGYRDSGMIGTPENDDPRALVQAPAQEVVDRIAAVIRELHPDVVITFGPDGFYGHPDHLMMYRTTTAAVLETGAASNHWRVGALYYATMPREWFVEVAQRPDNPFTEMTPDQIARLGTPLAEITTFVEVGPYVEVKRAVMEAHQTQFGDGGPLRHLSAEEYVRLLSREHFVRADLPWSDRTAPDDPLALLSAAAVR